MSAQPSVFEPLLGSRVTLVLRRFGSSGAFLNAPESKHDAPALLLLGSEIPNDAREGDELSVFVYLDSEGRPLATTAEPKLRLGEVAFLEVSDQTPFGAFFDWGLPKDLLVPFAEQTRELKVGERHPIGLYLDNSGRLSGTMKISRLLEVEPPNVVTDQWVLGEAWRNDPEIGLFAILQKTWTGLVPHHEPHSLSRGEAARFRVANVLADGKVELSLRGRAHDELEADAARLLELLSKPDPPKLGDSSPPERIRAACGLSKKAFKRAVGRLLRQNLVTTNAEGDVVVAVDSRR
jgi:hypothetical protein